MSRLIDADALYELLDGGYDLDFDEVPETKRELLRMISEQPTIEERKKGKWIDMGDFEQCSVCTGTHLKEVNTVYGTAIWIKSAYCQNCGADMRGEQGE